MATSGIYTFTVNRDDIIIDAYAAIGIGSEGEPLSGDMLSFAERKLNLIAGQLSGRPDQAPNFKMWTRDHGILFLQKDQYEYDIGPASTDDDATTDTYLDTTLSANAAALATTVTLASVTGIVSGDYIRILLNSGSWHSTTVNGAPSGSVVTLTDALPTAANSGKTVYNFTNKIQKPLEIITMLRRESNGDDQIVEMINVEQYERIPDKDATGDPTAAYYEEKRINGRVYFDTAIEDATDVISFVSLRPIQDFNAATDNPDYPKVWWMALAYMLAPHLALKYGKKVPDDLKELKAEALAIARNEDPEEVVHYFEPNRVDAY